MKLLFNKILKNSFFKNITILLSGTAIAQLITVALTPVLTRLYTPEDFGVLAIYTSIVGVLIVLVTMRLEMAIVLPKEDKVSINILAMALSFALIMTILMFLVALFLGEHIANLLQAPNISNWLWVAPISALFLGYYNCLNYWSTRKKKFKQLSQTRVTQASGTATGQLTLGLTTSGPGGLMFGQILGQMLGTLILAKRVYVANKNLLLTNFNPKHWGRYLKEYKAFPLFSSPQAILNVSSMGIPPLLLAMFFGPAYSGFYAMGMKLIQLPVQLVGDSFSQVYFQKLSNEYNNNNLVSRQVIKMTIKLAVIALLPSLLIFTLAPFLFSTILGDKWIVAGQFSSWLIVWIFFSFLNRPSVAAIQIIGLQGFFLIYEIILFFVRFLTLFIGAQFLSAIESIAIFSVVGGFANILLITYVYFAIKKKGY